MTLPKHHPYYNEYAEKAAVLQTEAGSIHIMSCKRDEYNVILITNCSIDKADR